MSNIPELFPWACCNPRCLKRVTGHHLIYKTTAHAYPCCSYECVVEGSRVWDALAAASGSARGSREAVQRYLTDKEFAARIDKMVLLAADRSWSL